MFVFYQQRKNDIEGGSQKEYAEKMAEGRGRICQTEENGERPDLAEEPGLLIMPRDSVSKKRAIAVRITDEF